MQINDRITYLDVMGHSCPLCMNVWAQTAFNVKFNVGIEDATELLDSEKHSMAEIFRNCIEILAILLDGGRRTVRMRARLAGEELPDIPEISADDLSCIYTPADMEGLMRTVYAALSASFGQAVEVRPVKNAGEAPAAEASA